MTTTNPSMAPAAGSPERASWVLIAAQSTCIEWSAMRISCLMHEGGRGISPCGTDSTIFFW